MKTCPLTFEPILKPKVWGGRSLAQLGKRLPQDAKIGESWEIADLPESVSGGRSVIANGPWRSMTLREVLNQHRDVILGDARPTEDGGFPLLIKFLDAQENLSVQVHPDRAYAARHPEAHLKSEAWVIVHAEPGAVIYKGIKPGVTAEQFAEHIRSGEAVRDLVAVPARVGDCHYLPSGTCHALGAGVVVAEVQTPSDTTFRVFDWNRTGPDRQLHVEQAMQCIQFDERPPSFANPHKPIDVGGIRTTLLAETEHFTIERIDAKEHSELSIVTSGLPEVWMLIHGSGAIHAPGCEHVELNSGTTVLIPAELEDSSAQLTPHSWLLRVKLPSPIKGMIA